MSLTPDAVRQILETAFIAAWVPAHASVPYFIEGVATPDLTKQKTAFVTFEVSTPRVVQSGLNGDVPPKRYYGNVLVGLFVPQGEGTQDFFLMQTTVENALSIQIISGILMGEIRPPLKRTPAIGWQGRNLSISYQFDSLP